MTEPYKIVGYLRATADSMGDAPVADLLRDAAAAVEAEQRMKEEWQKLAERATAVAEKINSYLDLYADVLRDLADVQPVGKSVWLSDLIVRARAVIRKDPLCDNENSSV
jgi:hypothetical protein